MLNKRDTNIESLMTRRTKSKEVLTKAKNFDIQENIKVAGLKVIDDNEMKYTQIAGMNTIKTVISEKILNENQVFYSEDEICVTICVKQAVLNTIFAICDEMDEVIIPIPSYVSYVDMVKLANAKPVLVEMSEDKKFKLDIEKIEAAISDKTKAIIINNPNNPTGTVYNRENLEKLAQLAIKYGIYVISDEVYKNFIYEDKKHICISSLDNDIKKLTVLINGVSKGYNMVSWGIGYVAGPREIVKEVTNLQGYMNTISQWEAIEALEGDKNSIRQMYNEYEYRRDIVYNGLSKIKGIKCVKSSGTFYLFPNISHYFGKSYKYHMINDSLDLANFLIDYAHVAIVPGTAFHSTNNIRISYSYSYSIQIIMDEIQKIENALSLLE